MIITRTILDKDTGVCILVSDGAPTNVNAPIGSVFLRRDGAGTNIVYFKNGPTNSDWATVGVAVTGSTVEWVDVLSKPTGLVSSSAQIQYSQITGTPTGLISSSAQVAATLPSGLVSSSVQVDYTQLQNREMMNGQFVMSGSVRTEVRTLTVTSNTASLDFRSGSLFQLTLPASTVVHLSASFVQQGQTVSLLVSQSGGGTLVPNAQFRFPTGSSYVASTTTGSRDVLTFVTFLDTDIYATAVKTL